MNKIFDKIMIIDGSYALHRNLRVNDLWELRSKIDNHRTGGVFGFLRSLNYMMRKVSYFPIICWESGLAERRINIYPNYKRHEERIQSYKLEDLARKSIESGETPSLPPDELDDLKLKINEIMENRKLYGTDTSPDDYLYQYRTQRSIIISICDSFGIPSIKISGWEGDDLMVLLTKLSNRSVVVTDDRDLLQLLSDTTDVYRVMNDQYFTLNEYLSKNGLSSIREMVVQKAIAGDGSDNIPSVTSGNERKYSVGDTTAWKLAKIIVENNEDPNQYIEALQNCPRDKNKISGFISRHDDYIRNLQLVDLSLVEEDKGVIDSIISEVMLHRNKANLIEVLGKLGNEDITSIDANGMIAKILKSYLNLFIGETNG